MTKNNAMRLGSVMLVLALLSSCALWGTFAKYTTKADAGEDTATVAKWDVTVTPSSNVAGFKKEYASDTTAKFANSTVVSTKNVLAPGTKSDGSVAPTLSGTSEVAIDISLADSTITLTNWVDGDGAYYCPIIVKVGDDAINGTDYASADLFKKAVEDKFKEYSKQVAPGTNLNTVTDLPVVTWEWAYETGADAQAKAANNVKDTALGTAADATVAFDIDVTLTQID